MKKIVYYGFLLCSLSFFVACSNGDYTANPGSNVDNSINPLHPLKSGDFNWTGTNPVSANINGAGWVATSFTYTFDSGKNIIYGYNGTRAIALFLTNTWTGNLYNMGFNQFNSSGYWTDSLGTISDYYFSSLGNSGGLWMLQNDTFAIKGLFYFQGINAAGSIVNVTNGYFNIPKF